MTADHDLSRTNHRALRFDHCHCRRYVSAIRVVNLFSLFTLPSADPPRLPLPSPRYCDFGWWEQRFSDDDLYAIDDDSKYRMIAIDTAFEDGVNCNKWLYDIPILEAFFGTPFIRGRHMANIVCYCDIIIVLTVLFATLHMKRMVRNVTQRVNSEHVSVEDYAVYVTGLPPDATDEEVRDARASLVRAGSGHARVFAR